MYFMVLLLGSFYEMVFITFVLDSKQWRERNESRHEDGYSTSNEYEIDVKYIEREYF